MGVWPRVMKREKQRAVYGLCNGREQEREKQRSRWRRERKCGEKKERGPSNDNKLDPHELRLDLNPTWIQKQAKG